MSGGKYLEYKECTQCHKSLPNTEEYFYKQKHKDKSGNVYYTLVPQCKECNRKRSNKYRVEHKKQHNDCCRKYKEEHKELMNERKRKWFAENTERAIDYQKEWNNSHREQLLEYSAFRQQHKLHKITKTEWENCKKYFNYECAYCGLPIAKHIARRRGKFINMDFHKEHIDSNGNNELSNCVPSCRKCNSQKNTLDFEMWYRGRCKNFTEERYNRIKKWINSDCYEYIET